MKTKIFIGLLVVYVCFFSCSPEESPIVLAAGGGLSSGGSQQLRLVEDTLGGDSLLLVGSPGRNLIVAFERTVMTQDLIFEAVQAGLPVIMEDNMGNRWDVHGRAVSGPLQGAQLERPDGGFGFWFFWGALYPGLELFEGDDPVLFDPGPAGEGWLIPTTTVAAGSGFDAIQSLDTPPFLRYRLRDFELDEAFYLQEDDLVIGVHLNGETKAYSHAILNWHEVINDQIGGVPVTVTYCPLTGTAKVWDRSGRPDLSFGVSGLLYNSNVIPFDRSTESLWTQMDARCVQGTLQATELPVLPFTETSWETWQQLEDEPIVLSEDTGINRDYTEYPYGSYRENQELIAYPIVYHDKRLPAKERVFVVVKDGRTKAWRLSDFD